MPLPDHSARSCRRGQWPERYSLVMLLVSMLIAAIGIGTPDKTAQASTESVAGQFLVATAEMPDPRFQETVIFMARHSSRGAMGVIVNKPLAEGSIADLAEKLGIDAQEPERELILHYGGPVRPDQGALLHSPDYRDADSIPLTPWASLSQSREAFTALANGAGPEKWIMALGYAGWAPGQLEGELTTGAWLVVDADPTLVFETPAEERWQRALDLHGVDL